MSESFANRWIRKWSACGFQDLATDFVRCWDALLPIQAAPFLNFDTSARPAPIWEVFGIPCQWPLADRERLDAWRVIGSDGAGNPICLEIPSSAVVLLDREDRFSTRQFVNSNVVKLAECLLAYMGEQHAERFRAAVQAIDSPALAERSFWFHEAACVAPYA